MKPAKRKTTYGLRPEQLARLWALALQNDDGRDSVGAGQTAAEVLRNMLDRRLPHEPVIPDSLPAILNSAPGEVPVPTGSRIEEILLDSKTDLAVIKALKDYYKKLVHGADSEQKQMAATVIYYAAIASALVFHRQKITNLSYHKLEKAYTDLEKEPWAPSELKDLFSRARAVCQQREPKLEQNEAP